MTSAGPAPTTSRTAWRPYLLPLALFAAALALRAYRAAAQPLWLDELFETQLLRQGVASIFRNSLWEPAPPLYHLLLWASTGFSPAPTEWAVRWLSVLCGALTVPVVFAFARRAAGEGAALGAALLLHVSPAHLYFSQEARAYAFSTLIAAASAWALCIERLPPARRWWLWAGLTVMGLWSHYAYVMVALVQAVYVVPRAWRQPGGRAALAAAAAGFVTTASLAAAVLPKRADLVTVAGLDLRSTLQALAGGDMLRYGHYWGHTWLTLALTALALLGVWRIARQGPPKALILLVGQVFLPLAGYFLVARPLMGIGMENYQTRQFLVLLPAVMGLVGTGLVQTREWAARWAGRWAGVLTAVALLAWLVYGSLVGISRYWRQTKSPEGLAVLHVRDHIAPGETVVSLHYSADAALGFYMADAPRFTKPLDGPNGPTFSDSTLVLLWEWEPSERLYTLADVAAYPARWVIWVEGRDDELARRLTAGCVVTATAEFRPFRVARAAACSGP